MKNFDLEALRSVLRDESLHIMLGIVKVVAVSPDRSTCRVRVAVLPEQREIVATMTWEAVGTESGFYMLPQPNDLVLVAQAEGDVEQAFIVKRLSSMEDKIPQNALDGSIVLKSIPGKKTWITSDTRINLTKADGSPTENLVLGQQLKQVLSTLIKTIYVQHKHIGNLGYFTAVPDNAPDATNLSTNNVDNEGILSAIAFTEKGS